MSALSKLKVLNTKYKKFLLSMSISILAFSFHVMVLGMTISTILKRKPGLEFM